MKIGIDIDDTIADCTSCMFEKMLKEDKNKRNTGILYENEHIFKPYGRFDWSKEEIDEFLSAHLEKSSKNFKVINDADKIISQLILEGNEIYLITYRTLPHWKNPKTSTAKWLKANNIKYTKLIFSKLRDKSEELKKYGIDFMIDDSVSSCLEMERKGINCILKITENNCDSKDLNNFKRKAKDWSKIYDIIKSELKTTNNYKKDLIEL